MTNGEELAAIEQIRKLKARYFYHLDHRDWDGLLTEVFAQHALIDVPGRFADPKSPSDFASTVSATLCGSVSVHHGHMPIITICSDREATGLWAMEDVIWWDDDHAYDGVYKKLQGYGHYHESYVRTPGGWRIQTLKLTRLKVILS